MTSKTVAVIGCGVTGLAAMKCCLDEGLQPTCFERSDGVGGLWVYRDNSDREMVASVFKSTVTNPSKEAMCYSDFPFPKEWPNYLHNSYMKKYCDMYAHEFGLKERICFSTRVTRLSQAPDYESTGRWVVTAQTDGASRHVEEFSQVFDAVMVCTGMFNNPYIPEFPGLEEFQGKVLHSHDYRRPEEFKGKRVVVVGVGNSAGDAAADIAEKASQVFMSIRRGAWLISRPVDSGSPTDLMLMRRFQSVSTKLDVMLYKKGLNRLYDLIKSPMLRPSHDLAACEPLTNENLPGCILDGSVILKSNLARLTEKGVEFEDGTREVDIDVVIMATGYRFKFPFRVDCPALETKQGRVPLYKLVWPLGRMHDTLSVHGALTPIGPVIPCVELQARWAARVFSGLAELPRQSEMKAEVGEAEDHATRFLASPYRFVEPISYMDSVASEIGVKPNFVRLFLTEPLLTLRCLFGPHVPYQYRLVGPGKWRGAKKAINTVWERVLEPPKTRRRSPPAECILLISIALILVAAILIVGL